MIYKIDRKTEKDSEKKKKKAAHATRIQSNTENRSTISSQACKPDRQS